MSNDDELLFEPDDDASELDRHVMRIAKDLHRAGWPDEAQSVASSAAELRETWTQPIGDGFGGVYSALESIQGSAESILEVITRIYPDEIALKH